MTGIERQPFALLISHTEYIYRLILKGVLHVQIITIQGGKSLEGVVRISGAKNASLPIMAASILTGDKVVIEGVPDLIDVKIMTKIIKSLGADVSYDNEQETANIHLADIIHHRVPHELGSKMRASFLVVGPLLARQKKARISLPGGCAIGVRPIDLHWKGLTALGAEFTVDDGYVEAKTAGLKGAHIYLDYPSVGATENIMMAATLAKGTTIIENASIEPEIVDLASLLTSMGGKISGAGTTTIKIDGVNLLRGVQHMIIPDRIEAGTFMIATAVLGGKVRLQNVVYDHLKSLIAKLTEAGVVITQTDGGDILIESKGNRLRSVDIKTLPYPGFPTDLQPQISVLLALSQGVSMITETVFENRFLYVEELIRMGAEIKVQDQKLIIQGKEKIYGAEIKATDLRAAAALIIAGLAANGRTEVSGVFHLDRGYFKFDEKLKALGANIIRHPFPKLPHEGSIRVTV